MFGVEEAQRACIKMLESGPAAGVIGTKALCDSIGLGNAIAFDMGGTTAKAGVIHHGEVLMTGSALIGGYATGLPVQIPMIDIQEVGTGGGSIARVGTGALHVGPESAGAQPGPVCYGLGGTEPTITDANLVLGRLGADRFLGGEMRLDLDGAKRALDERVAKPLGLDLTQAADGILRIATTKMSHMVRWVTTERGLDAADFALVAYGGAGPLHAAMVARELRIAKVVIPRAPGHFSAYGMLVADLRRDFVNTWFTPLAEASFRRHGRRSTPRWSGAGATAVCRKHARGRRDQPCSARPTCAMSGRSTPSPSSCRSSCSAPQDRDGIKQRFDAVHETRYGYSAPGEKAEIVSLRSAVTGLLRKPAFEPIATGGAEPPRRRFAATRRSISPKPGATSIRRPMTAPGCVAGNRIAGPALIEEYASTTVVHPGDYRHGRCLRRPGHRDSAELSMDAELKSKGPHSQVAQAEQRIDPVTTEIVRNGLVAATEEMKTNLMRTAYNMIIYEALDFTVGLFDAQGNTVSIGLGLPMFIRGMSDTMKTKLAHYGVENLDPGDILLTNDAYITGSHLNHMTFTVPIFCDGELVAFSCCMAHWPDVGGTLDGATTDIYSEGLQMPIVKIYRKGVPNDELISDHQDQRAAARARDGRLPRPDRGGQDRRAALPRDARQIRPRCRARRHRSDHGPQRGRVAGARRAKFPTASTRRNRSWTTTACGSAQRVPIRVRVVVKGDQMTVDLTDVSKQVAGFYNSGETAGRSCCQVAFKCLTSALDLPINDGQFRALEIVLPPGRVVSALKPAAMRMWMTYPMTVIDTIFKALAPAIPDQVMAGHHADLVVGRINGRRPKDDSFYIYLGGLIGGGWGAKHDSDGSNSTIAMNDGDTHNGPSRAGRGEVSAAGRALRAAAGFRRRRALPRRARLRAGGAGAPRHPLQLADGPGQVQAVGARGRALRLGNRVAIHRFGKTEEQRFHNGKALNQVLHAGDAYVLRSGGGGGFGSPLDRDLAALARDVRCGYVTTEAAEKDYGAVFLDGTNKLDVAATEQRRAEMRAQGLPHDEPIADTGVPPPAPAHVHTHDHEHEKLTEEERVALAMTGRCCS